MLRALAHVQPVFIGIIEPLVARDIKHIRAERGNVSDERLVQAIDGRAHERDGEDADDDAERGQHRAHFVRAQGVPGNAQAFVNFGKKLHWIAG